MIGGNQSQYSTWYGFRNSDEYLTVNNDSASVDVGDYTKVFMYPGEYNVYAGGGLDLTYEAKENGFEKRIKIYDHLGSVRATVDANDQVISEFDYKPFGEKLITFGDSDRTGFVGKENDIESNLADHGVRKLDYLSGRFTSMDKLWEKYIQLTPYQYSNNNPILLIDINGEEIVLKGSDDFITRTDKILQKMLDSKTGFKQLSKLHHSHIKIVIEEDKTGGFRGRADWIIDSDNKMLADENGNYSKLTIKINYPNIDDADDFTDVEVVAMELKHIEDQVDVDGDVEKQEELWRQAHEDKMKKENGVKKSDGTRFGYWDKRHEKRSREHAEKVQKEINESKNK